MKDDWNYSDINNMYFPLCMYSCIQSVFFSSDVVYIWFSFFPVKSRNTVVSKYVEGRAEPALAYAFCAAVVNKTSRYDSASLVGSTTTGECGTF